LDFSREITERRTLSTIVNTDASIATAHGAFLNTLDQWWIKHVQMVEALAPRDGKKGNVYELRRALLVSIEQTFDANTLLTGHQIRGAFARCVDEIKADLKSIAASGWGAELIPDVEIIASQFPEVLRDMETNRARVAELSALFSAADEEDYEADDDIGVLPEGQVKQLKAKLKETKGNEKLAKRDPGLGDWNLFKKEAEAIESRLARHKALEDEAKHLKAALRATEKKQEELVAAARAKISGDEARNVIVERVRHLLVQIYTSYLQAYQRSCLAALENLYAKYAVTAKDIEFQRDAASLKLRGYLNDLGYV
jgi:type I restriction enzyme M protein